MMQEIALNEKKYFEIFIGERVLKKDVFQSGYNIPVYSANVFKPFGYIPESNISNFNYDYLIWGIDGDFNFNLIPYGTVFATTDHCGAIRILHKHIVPEYILYLLRLQAHSLGFDRGLRSSLKNMQNIVITLPLDDKGNFDVKKQIEIAEKYKKVWKIKSSINQKIDELEGLKVQIDTNKGHKIKLETIFDFPETNSRVTKEFCEKNKGTIPVYGCSKSETVVLGNIGDELPNIKYYKNSLTWNRNGSVGYVFYREGKFSTNEDHRVLSLKSELKDQIDLFYIKNALENEIKKLGFGFTNKLGKAKIKEIEIDVPMIKIGSVQMYDISEQRRLARQYQDVYNVRKNLINKLRSIGNIVCEVA